MWFKSTIRIISPNGSLMFNTSIRIVIEFNIVVLPVVIILNIRPIIANPIPIYVNLYLVFPNIFCSLWQIFNILVNCIIVFFPAMRFRFAAIRHGPFFQLFHLSFNGFCRTNITLLI